MHESWQANFNEIHGEIERFEEMESGHKTYYFDVHTIETIFEFYTDKFQFEKAEKALQIGIRQHPYSTSLQAKRAIILMEKGDDKNAINIMENLLQLEQSNPEVLMNLGLAYLRNRREAEAIRFFRRALEVSIDEREDVMLDIGVYLNQQELHAEVIKFLEPGCREFPYNENILFELAFAYDKVFEIEKSFEVYNQLIDINPFSENAWYNMGILYIKIDDFENANRCYDFTLALDPSHGEALFNKGNSLVNQGSLLEAIDCYIEYISHGYDAILPYHYIADCLDQAGLQDLAARFYRLILDKDPAYLPAWIGYLAMLINLEDVNEALDVSERALQYHGEIDELLYLRARGLMLDNRLVEAKSAFELCFRDNPDSLRNAFELLQIKKALSPKINVEKLLRGWLKSFPESAAIHYLACAHYLIDDRDLTIASWHLEYALVENPDEYLFFLELYPNVAKMVLKSKKLTKLVNQYFGNQGLI